MKKLYRYLNSFEVREIDKDVAAKTGMSEESVVSVGGLAKGANASAPQKQTKDAAPKLYSKEKGMVEAHRVEIESTSTSTSTSLVFGADKISLPNGVIVNNETSAAAQGQAVAASTSSEATPSGTDVQESLKLDLHKIRKDGGSSTAASTSGTPNTAPKDASPFETSTTCSEAGPLSPIAESGDAFARLASALGWKTKRGKTSRRASTDKEAEASLHSTRNHHQAKPPKLPPKGKGFSLWGGGKKKGGDVPLHRALGGGSKANIDAVFNELKSTAAGEHGALPSRVLSGRKPSTDNLSTAAAREPPSSAGSIVTGSPAAASNTSVASDTTSPVQRGASFNRLRTLSTLVPAVVAMAAAKKPQKAPRLELEKDKDWIVEYYKDVKEPLKIEKCTIVQNLQVRACEGVTLQVTEKLNNVIIESCKKTNVLLTGLISSVELVHCDKVKLQVLGKCPSVNMDNCAGITLYVGKEGRDVSVTSSKSSDMNVSFPTDDAEEDWIEVPIPQQFVHTINQKHEVESRVSDLYR